MTTRIRRYVETDTGIEFLITRGAAFHGHRYRFEAEIEGDIVDKRVSEEECFDFVVSQILTTYIHDIVDHAVVYEGDEEVEPSITTIVRP